MVNDSFIPRSAVTSTPIIRVTVLAGSGNLTPGGLMTNYEAFSIVRGSEGELLDITELRSFLAEHADDLFPPDDEEVLARAERNMVRGHGRRRRAEEADVVEVTTGEEEEELGEAEATEELLLIAVAPKSRGGWRQLQINKPALRVFFRIPARRGEPLLLRQWHSDGRLGPKEHRRLVYSEESNRNLKFDVRAGGEYPEGGKPVLIFRRRRAREFEYVALTPGDEGYDQVMTHVRGADDSIGPGVKRVLRTPEEVRTIWPECPIPLFLTYSVRSGESRGCGLNA